MVIFEKWPYENNAEDVPVSKLLLQRASEEDTPRADRPPYPGTPRWVKVFAIIVLVVVLLVVIILVTGIGGDHGPDRHRRSGDAGGGTPPIEYVVEDDGPADHAPPMEHGVQQR
jgi:hypothetical protein